MMHRFGTGEDGTIDNEEQLRRHAGSMPPITDLSLAMRSDPLALIRGVTEFVTVIYGPAVTFAFADVKVEAYRRSVLHLNLISAVDENALNWSKQHVLRETRDPERRLIVCKDVGVKDDAHKH